MTQVLATDDWTADVALAGLHGAPDPADADTDKGVRTTTVELREVTVFDSHLPDTTDIALSADGRTLAAVER